MAFNSLFQASTQYMHTCSELGTGGRGWRRAISPEGGLPGHSSVLPSLCWLKSREGTRRNSISPVTVHHRGDVL